MSIIDPYTCVNYFMSVLVANIFSSKFDCRPRPIYLGLSGACCIYCVNLCVLVLCMFNVVLILIII